VDDPFVWTLGFRLVSGLLGWLAIAGLALCIRQWFPTTTLGRAAVRALCLAWFVPYLAVRTSSESLAGSCLVLGLSLLVLVSTKGEDTSASPFALSLVGLLFGLACEFRYAVAVAVVSVLLWAAHAGRVPARRMFWLAPGFFLAAVLGVCVDRWGYGTWAFPPYEYVVRNLVEGRAAQRFGDSPWYGYFALAFMSPAAPLVLIVMSTTLFSWVRKPFHPLTWATGPFFLVHCLIRHKEMRFLFPVALLTPVLLVLALAPLGDRWDRWLRPVWQARHQPIGRAFLGLNVLALAVLCLTPPRPQVTFQRFVRRHYPERFEAYLLTPFSPWVAGGLSMYFYRPQTLVLHQVATLDEIERQGLRHFLLITGSFDSADLPGRTYSCELLYRSLPYQIRRLLAERVETIPAWNLYRCVPRALLHASSDHEIPSWAGQGVDRPPSETPR
jgi:phosphatidylinositol glycan class B